MPVRTATDDPDGIPASSAAYKSSPAESAEPRVGSTASGASFFTCKSKVFSYRLVRLRLGLFRRSARRIAFRLVGSLYGNPLSTRWLRTTWQKHCFARQNRCGVSPRHPRQHGSLTRGSGAHLVV